MPGESIDGRYRTIVADPPWPIGDFPAWHDKARRSKREREIGTNPTPYSTMSLDEIKALPVSNLADTGAHLYLWTINDYLVQSFEVAKTWGFAPSTVLVWCKPPMGLGVGGAFASNVEFVLFCRRRGGPTVLAVTQYLADAADRAGITRAQVDVHMGTSDMGGWWLSRLEHRCAVPTWAQYERLKTFLCAGDDMDDAVLVAKAEERSKGERSDTRWFCWPRGSHSAKPEAFIDLVERMSPGPYVELFARRARFGWDYWGDQSLGTAQMEGAA